MPSLKVFVYGTLKPGYDNYDRYCGDRLLASQPAKVKGALYALPVGYPGMTYGEQWVQGYLLTLKEDGQTLQDLDALEDYHPHQAHSLYQREITKVFKPEGECLGEAWVYFMAIATVRSMQGRTLPSGCWQPRSQETNI